MWARRWISADRGGCLSRKNCCASLAVLKSPPARQKAYSEGEEKRAGAERAGCVLQQITTNKYLEERIFTSILSKGQIADAASSELASIRRKIRQQSAIRESLQKIITSPSYAKILQEPIGDHPLDRFVVPSRPEW